MSVLVRNPKASFSCVVAHFQHQVYQTDLLVCFFSVLNEPVHQKTNYCICETKGADQQLCSYCSADQCLCFRSIFSMMPLKFFFIQNLKLLAILCGCTAWSVSDLVGNPGTSLFTPVLLYKSGVYGVYITQTCYCDEHLSLDGDSIYSLLDPGS